ncbi:MAG: hypothetical protein BM557_07960 [Flavobacterium sp. MedPE-SWcel]|uniref:hypothetical protein n=1 Tax=uncultured Flavobacterium sp. TaxID=165435 RepID=UPI00091C61FB|nr:hypothetical protein [uncultured Flavobacterium sp.]OIQ17615.1 MAG: hypothetical protein BM557_07960 [Flavobacterium sp. MedPE-SWcel]
MKNLFLLLSLSLFLGSCSDDDSSVTPPNETENKVLLLKVDMQTNAFEGGKELTFPEFTDFTIETSYIEPGDFGDIELKYQEADAPIFAGTIVWAGLGEMTYPEILNTTTSFTTIDTPVQAPTEENFELVQYSDYSVYPELINYNAIWGAIDDLQLVKEYRDENPNAKVNLLLYTPSVGVGNPAEWDWFIILKN